MRPSPFELIQTTSLEEALLATSAGATPLAGGQSLIQAMRLGNQRPAQVVDLASIQQLHGDITVTNENITIGAKVTHKELAENSEIASKVPWLSEAANKIGDVQVRALGTTVGNLCWADPRANMGVALLASNAVVDVALHSGSRDGAIEMKEIPVSALFAGFQQTTIAGGIVCQIKVPNNSEARGTYLEFSRQPQDLALVNVAIVTSSSSWQVAVGGIAPQAMRISEIETRLNAGADLTDLESYLQENSIYQPPDDAFGDRAYKLHLASTLIRRALERLKVR